VVFYHGGGFVAGSIDTHAGLAAEIARRLDLPVVSVEYRLAPEHKWPAAPDDAEAAARWIAENAAAFGREFTHLVLCGDSAGGNLTLVTALALRDTPAALPLLAQIPIYPMADASREHASMTTFADGYGLEAANMAYYRNAFQADHLHPRYSPLLADLAGLPPTLLVTAALDPLRDGGRAFAAAAVLSGAPVIYREYAGTIHGFCSYRKLIPSAQTDTLAFLALAKAMIAEALAR
jgi:acetyl esterase